MSNPVLPPEVVLISRLLDGARLSFALVAALDVKLFGALAAGPSTCSQVAARAKISERGAQVLLDTFVALDLVTISAGKYKNSAAAELHLVPGAPGYVGDEHGALLRAQSTWMSRLPEAVRSGHPVVAIDDPTVLDFWTHLTPVISRMSAPVAAAAVRELGLTNGAPSLLDVGGGMALYSLALLSANPKAHATQLDWPHINQAARAQVEKAGFGDRFATLDGDFRSVRLPDGAYDVAVLSHIMHQESPASNGALLAALHKAVRPGGHLIIAEFVVDNGRTGPPSSLLFNLNMLPLTEGGKSYERGELAALVTEAGFGAPRFVPTGPMTTLILAARGS